MKGYRMNKNILMSLSILFLSGSVYASVSKQFTSEHIQKISASLPTIEQLKKIQNKIEKPVALSSQELQNLKSKIKFVCENIQSKNEAIAELAILKSGEGKQLEIPEKGAKYYLIGFYTMVRKISSVSDYENLTKEKRDHIDECVRVMQLYHAELVKLTKEQKIIT